MLVLAAHDNQRAAARPVVTASSLSRKRPDTVGEVARLAESGISRALASPPEPCHVARSRPDPTHCPSERHDTKAADRTRSDFANGIRSFLGIEDGELRSGSGTSPVHTGRLGATNLLI